MNAKRYLYLLALGMALIGSAPILCMERTQDEKKSSSSSNEETKISKEAAPSRFFQAVKEGNSVDVFLLASAQNAYIHTEDIFGNRALHFAAAHGDYNMIKLLLWFTTRMNPETRVAYINVENRDHHTPLYLAVTCGHLSVAKELLDNGAKVDGAYWGPKPLYRAAEMCSLEMIRLLLDRGAFVDIHDPKNNESALHLAARTGDVAVAKLLLDRGSNVNNLNLSHKTPLYVAAEYGQLAMVSLLITRGGTINSKRDQVYESRHPNDALTPIQIATRNGHLKVVQMLLRAGAHVNPQVPAHHKVIDTILQLFSNNRLLAAAVMGDTLTFSKCVSKKTSMVELVEALEYAAGQCRRDIVRIIIGILIERRGMQTPIEGALKIVQNILRETSVEDDAGRVQYRTEADNRRTHYATIAQILLLSRQAVPITFFEHKLSPERRRNLALTELRRLSEEFITPQERLRYREIQDTLLLDELKDAQSIRGILNKALRTIRAYLKSADLTADEQMNLKQLENLLQPPLTKALIGNKPKAVASLLPLLPQDILNHILSFVVGTIAFEMSSN